MSTLSAFCDTFILKKKPETAAVADIVTSTAAHINTKMVETNKKPYTEQTDSELAELATQEISLDLHGLIDDSQFADDNLFGDLMETAKKNDASAGAHHPGHWLGGGNGGGNGAGAPGTGMIRGGTPSSGSSGQNSPGGGSDGHGSPVQAGQYGGQYGAAGRNTLAYLPGSVHAAGFNQINQHSLNQNVQVKQEPMESEYSTCPQTPSSTTPQYPLNTSTSSPPSCTQSQGVSSTTNYILPEQFSPQSPSGSSPPLPFAAMQQGSLTNLKSFSAAHNLHGQQPQQQQPKYLLQKKKMLPGGGGGGGIPSPNLPNCGGAEKSTDEYRRRRERNNVAVRKSREKAKLRTRETEERVKILARENDRLQKKNELLQEELGVLRSLFSSVGVLPDHVQREVAKHLESFQAQHAAINY